MAAHLVAANELQMAVAQGRLSDARDQARWFVTHDMAGPPAWEPYVDELRDAATRISDARDVPTAGMQLGRLGRACSSCHEAERAKPAFDQVAQPAGGETLEAQMARHQWAAARLWEGVVGPDDQRWQDGALMMATDRISVARAVHEKPNVEMIELGERLRDQARRALAIEDPASRATSFGMMMETCASCHAIARPHAVTMIRRTE